MPEDGIIYISTLYPKGRWNSRSVFVPFFRVGVGVWRRVKGERRRKRNHKDTRAPRIGLSDY
jgi:hypothetical protein